MSARTIPAKPPPHNPVQSEKAFAEILMKEPHGDWYTLGLVLGLPEPKLKQINQDFKGKKACLKRLYKCLVMSNVTGTLTWECIADALSSPPMKCFALAEEVVKQYQCLVSADVDEADRQLFAFLLDLLRYDSTLNFDKVGFVKVSDILELHAYAGGWQKFRERDIRRVVAGHPILTLDEGPPLKIRTNGGHAGSDELNEIKENLQKEKRLYMYLLHLCQYGVFEKELHFNSDGSVNITDIMSLEFFREFDQKDIINAIKYNKKDEIVLLEKTPKVFSIRPTMGPYKIGPVHYPKESVIYDKLMVICQDKEYPPLNLAYDEEGYVAVSDVLPLLHEYNTTEADVQQAVETCSRKSLSLKNKLGFLMIKANWGHCREVVYHESRVSSYLDVSPFIVRTVTRRYWVQIKKNGLKTVAKETTILFSYSEKELSDEAEFWEHYGHHNVVIVLDLKKALQDGLEFVKIPPEKLICLNSTLDAKYFKKVIT